jgi:hypothetical protein
MLDSLAGISSQYIAQQTVLAWMDTITHRFSDLVDTCSIQLLSPSVQVKGLEAVKNNSSSAWTYKVTLKIFQLAETYCDVLNFHWYPDTYEQMQYLLEFVDTAAVLNIDPHIKMSCTEWSQAHEIKLFFNPIPLIGMKNFQFIVERRIRLLKLHTSV